MVDLGLLAAEEAMADAGDIAGPFHQIVGASSLRDAQADEERKRGTGDAYGVPADPGLLLLSPPQALADAISGAFGFKGPSLSVNTACAAGTNAIGYGADLIRQGHVDAVLVGGSDELTEVNMCRLRALEGTVTQPCSPFSRDRLGLKLGEGAGMLVFTREDVAERFGAAVRAEVRGYGLSADGFHPSRPTRRRRGSPRDPRGHACGRHNPGGHRLHQRARDRDGRNDAAETNAIHPALGNEASRVLVSSTKSMIGHLLGAAGAVEAVITVRALQEQIAPPTANYAAPDPECDLDYVPNVARAFDGDVAISNSFASGARTRVSCSAED